MKIAAISTQYQKLPIKKDKNSFVDAHVKQQNFSSTSNPISLVDLNYSSLLVKNKQVSFKAVPSVAMKTIALEEKIATIFEKFNHGDLLLVGKDLKSVKNAMKNSISQIKTTIKKVLFIEDKELSAPLAFFKNDSGKKEFVNIGEGKVFIKNDKSSTFLDPGDSLEIELGDVLKVGKKEIPIKLSLVQQEAYKKGEKAETLSLIKDLYTKVIPVEKNVEKSIEAVNRKTLDNLIIDGSAFAKKQLSLSDVGGQDKAITDLKKSILLPLKNPEYYQNRKINRGFILEGGPGTGKTLAAKALANDCDVHFIQVNGPEIESKWVGESGQNLIKVFNEAKALQPSIILFDEIDSIAKKRGGVDVFGDKLLNQFLTEMTSLYDDGDNVFVLATTNRADMLDEAISRSKRFGKVIHFGLPETVNDVKQILDIHVKDRPIAEDFDPAAFSKKLLDIKVSGADISQIVEDAHDQAFERLGLFEKMELGSATKADLENLKLTKEDFDNALVYFKEHNMAQKMNSERKVIGFNAINQKMQKNAEK